MKVTFKSKENRTLSPYTGWTRERWLELAEKMIAAIQAYLTPGKGGVALPNPLRWMDAFLPEPDKMKSFYWMEGYTRSRALFAAWLVGSGKTTIEVKGNTINILDQFREGLLSVSDPSSAEYIGERYGSNVKQWILETSAVALAIYMTKELVWDNLSRGEQKQIVQWMHNATGQQIPHNNWYTFPACIHYVLRALGEKYDRDELNLCLQRIKDFYLGDGWFDDGGPKRGYSVDQYNAWGFHYFLPAYVYLGEDDPELKDWIIDCLQKFIVSYERFIGANGSLAMWGRSWIYRPALTVPFIWAEILDVSPLPPGEVRRIASGQMKFYVENNYFKEDLTPQMGYIGENLELIEPYSTYGSPYWGTGIFYSLLLPASHPFWTDEEQPLPVERESYCVSENKIGMLVAGNKETGEVQMINHRAWHQKEGPGTKYAKKYTNLAYSTDFGIDLKRTEKGYNCDNMISISPDGEKFSQRIIPYFIKVGESYGASYYYPMTGFPFIGHEDAKAFSGDYKNESKEDRSVKITMQIYLKDFCQIRVHTVETERSLAAVREGGFALNYYKEVPEAIEDRKSIGFYDGRRGAFIKTLWGFEGPQNLKTLLRNRMNFNTRGGYSITPTIVGGRLEPGKHIFVSLSGTWIGTREDLLKRMNIVDKTVVEEDRVLINFADKSTFIFDV